MTGAPPRLATLLLRALLPRAVRDESADDLADLYRLRLTRDGRAAADRWYRRSVMSYALRLRLAGLPGEPVEPVPPRPPRSLGEYVGSLFNDVRYGLRGLRRNPGFAAIAVFTLALGIGANAAIFSVVRNVLLRPLPFPEPERVVQLWEARVPRGITQASFTHQNFWDLRDQNHSLEAVGAMTWGSLTLTGHDQPQRLTSGAVSAGFFRALGTSPLAGRLFVAGEDEPPADSKIVVLGHALWRDRFAADTAIIGRRIVLNGEDHLVIGVLPRGTPWLDWADLFVPMVRSPEQSRTSFELAVVARLKPGVSLEAARADLDAVGRHIAELHPESKDMSVTVGPARDWIASASLRSALYVLSAAVALLLLIACVNLANLLLARATGRTRESALRAALGADRGRIVRHVLTEAALLGLIGAAAGLGLAFGMVRLFRTMDPGRIPRLADVQVDGWVLGLTLVVALVTSLAAALVPALRSPYNDILTSLREGERSVAGSRGAGRLRAGLVSVEVALSLMLLVGAGLLVRSFGALLEADRGFHTEQRVFFDVGMPAIHNEADFFRIAAMQEQLLQRLRGLHGVSAAAAVSARPLRGVGTGMGFAAADQPPEPNVSWASWRRVSDAYFTAMGVPLLAGRDFGAQDGRGTPLRVIISKSIADRLWPGQTAVGRQFIAWRGQGERQAEVIGVVGDMRDWGLADGPSLAVYLPFQGRTWDVVNFVVHTGLTPEALRPALRGALDAFDPTMPLGEPRTLEDLVGESVAARRFTMVLLASLAALALLLALAGVYGVLAYTVSRRRPELGVRVALGATTRDVFGLVLAQGMRPVVIGVVAGILGAVALSRFMASLLFGVTRGDVATYAAMSALLLGVAAVACWIPARSALRVDVVAALREE